MLLRAERAAVGVQHKGEQAVAIAVVQVRRDGVAPTVGRDERQHGDHRAVESEVRVLDLRPQHHVAPEARQLKATIPEDSPSNASSSSPDPFPVTFNSTRIVRYEPAARRPACDRSDSCRSPPSAS
jgi:hypothetical protein